MPEALEEAPRFKQEMYSDYADIGGEETVVKREIGAQSYMLLAPERYIIPTQRLNRPERTSRIAKTGSRKSRGHAAEDY